MPHVATIPEIIISETELNIHHSINSFIRLLSEHVLLQRSQLGLGGAPGDRPGGAAAATPPMQQQISLLTPSLTSAARRSCDWTHNT